MAKQYSGRSGASNTSGRPNARISNDVRNATYDRTTVRSGEKESQVYSRTMTDDRGVQFVGKGIRTRTSTNAIIPVSNPQRSRKR